MSKHATMECPICFEVMDSTDRKFIPCPCGYQPCIWCYHRLKDISNTCPTCRRPYVAVTQTCAVGGTLQATSYSTRGEFFSSTDEESSAEGTNSSSGRRRLEEPPPTTPSRSADLRDVRVVRRDLCYVVGLPLEVVVDEEALKGFRFLGKYGSVANVIVNKNPNFKAPDKKRSCAIYVTYKGDEEAKAAILDLDDSVYAGRRLRASFGTTKYCSSFLRNVRCSNRNCFYLHEKGSDQDSFTVAQMNKAKELSRGLTCSALLVNEFRAAQEWKGNSSLFGKCREETLEYFSMDPRGRRRPPIPSLFYEIEAARRNLQQQVQHTEDSSGKITARPSTAPPTSTSAVSLIVLTPPPLLPPRPDEHGLTHPALNPSPLTLSTWDPTAVAHAMAFLDCEGTEMDTADDEGDSSTAILMKDIDEISDGGGPFFHMSELTLDEFSEVIKAELAPRQPSSLLEAYVTPADQRAITRNPDIQNQVAAMLQLSMHQPQHQPDSLPPGFESARQHNNYHHSMNIQRNHFGGGAESQRLLGAKGNGHPSYSLYTGDTTVSNQQAQHAYYSYHHLVS